MTDRDDITAAAVSLVTELIVNNKAEYEARIGPVIDKGSRHNHGTWRVKVEKVEG